MIRKRLLHITHDLQIGGLQQVIVTLCKYIDTAKFHVSVLCLRERGIYAKELERLDIPVHLLPKKNGKTDYFAFFKVAAFLRKNQIDIIHTHNTQPLLDGVLGALLSRRKLKIIHTDHARSFPDKKRYMFAEWFLSHFTDKIVGVSDDTSFNLIKYEKIAPAKIITIYNGIDPLPFNVRVDRNKILQDIGIYGDGPIIGLGVRLVQQKGITYLLGAMPQILQAFPSTQLVIAGEGELEESLKKQAISLGISDYVHFLGPRLDMPVLLKIFDIYVLPSLWEGLPMVLLEAMAAGCPIVATDVGGNSIAVKNEVTGLLVPPKKSPELANAVITLLSDPNKRQKMSKASVELFRKKFSAEIMARKYERLYYGC